MTYRIFYIIISVEVFMKILVVFMLCLVSIHTHAQPDFTEAEKQKFILGMKNGDYSVLLPFFQKEDLNTFIPLRNGDIVIKEAPAKVDCTEYPKITKPFAFKQAGKTVIYTNRYKAKFINDQEILWDLDEIKSMHNAVCYGFYNVMKKAFKAKNPQDIINIYNEYNDSIYTLYYSGLFSAVLDKAYNFYGMGSFNPPDDLYLEERQKIADYLFPILYPTKEQQRTALLNLPLHRLANYDGRRNIIRVHYNQKDPWRECD